MKKNIWIDCDPGIDDAAALALASAHREELNIIGISTVSGNQTDDLVTQNALKLCEFLGMEDIPVIHGAEQPLIRDVFAVPNVHGEDGLGNCGLEKAQRKKISGSGIQPIRDGIMGAVPDEKIILVATGPFTNVGLLLAAFPEVKEKISQIVIMGGADRGGNTTPEAEFNVYVDPEAAQIMFRSGLPIVMAGLDVTSQCYITSGQIDALLASEGTASRIFGRMFDFYRKAPFYEMSGTPHLHDAVCIAWLLHPEYFHGTETYVKVDCSETTGRGNTICDLRPTREKAPNTLLLDHADTESFIALMLEALRWQDRRKS